MICVLPMSTSAQGAVQADANTICHFSLNSAQRYSITFRTTRQSSPRATITAQHNIFGMRWALGSRNMAWTPGDRCYPHHVASPLLKNCMNNSSGFRYWNYAITRTQACISRRLSNHPLIWPAIITASLLRTIWQGFLNTMQVLYYCALNPQDGEKCYWSLCVSSSWNHPP